MSVPTADKALEVDLLETRAVGDPKRKRKSLSFDSVSTGEKVLRYVFLVVMLVVAVGPFLWQFSTSLKGPLEDIYSASLSLIPSQPTIDNYIAVWDAIPVWKYIGNSLLVAALAVGGNVVFTTMAGFAVARMKFAGKGFVIACFMGVLILPGEATIIAQFVTIKNLGLADQLLGVALPGMVGALNVLLMWNAFRIIPKEIDEAAVVDGATVWSRLKDIHLPAVRGTMAVIAIFAFIGAWDDFLWPLIVLTTPDRFTLTIGLQYLAGTFSTNQRIIAAGTMVAFIPIAILFASLQRYFFMGVEEGGVKG
ncbi:carbohydrate ABC transporter membrane protein 2 (CUT1 family) [Salana multivorans]|uniref:Carbohydrate ABC transporter membrane protein 2 (CUT1 family) n=1 Tax=Salana multivorans TaxID=120377 RepID=A0A3N2D8N6_9MICO|nr:carbohydrate ABC transporter permease [Salana multivorans]MBN8881055.1 carbohydrate ABC transporter permease [Salana multivorans]ROR96151.1 carbohydrate ABC transporter membrane protein 2 (CUT1 family) [Salana multivorans]